MARLAEDESGVGGDARGRDAAVLGRTALIRMTPQYIDGLLDKLSNQVAPELEKELKQDPYAILKEFFGGRLITRQSDVVALIVHRMMRHYTSSTLGQIVPPGVGLPIILNRIKQAAKVLLGEYKSYAALILNQITEKKLSGRDFEEEVRNLIDMQKVILQALDEFTNRMTSLYAINLPMILRPPLANARMGVEVFRAEVPRAEVFK